MAKFTLIALIIFLASFLRFWELGKVDLTADEIHYANEGQGYLNHDPYISLRHHPFRHISPHVGHPFLVGLLTSYSYDLLGVSTFSFRLVEAVAGVFTIALIFLLEKEFGRKVVFLGAFLLTISPFFTRFNRDGHLDSVFTLWTTLVAISIWRYSTSKQTFWLAPAGVASGLAASTKLYGVISIFLAIILLAVLTLSKKYKFDQIRKLILSTVIFLIPAAFVFFLFNDPGAYLDGILSPSDKSYKLFSGEYWQEVVASFAFWPKVLFYLLSPVIFLLWLVSLVFLILKKTRSALFLLFWQVCLLPLLVFHKPGVSGEYGIISALVPIIISVSYVISQIKGRLFILAVFTLVLFILPYTFFWGLRLKPLPYYSENYEFNRTIKDNYFSRVILKINTYTAEGLRVYLLPQSDYPIINLREDISWSYVGDINDYDVFVIDDPTLIKAVSDKVVLLEVISGRQDGKSLTRYIFKKVKS